jgi:2-polyprenyl-3-methyl-5-hydroxy-6-metoxy-1,4-benzoquinol methylase
MLNDQQDAFGHSIYDCLQDTAEFHIVERDDGDIAAERLNVYFNQYKNWRLIEKKAMKFVRGKVLDIGCGAGRHALYLQEKGHEVVGIDISPLAIKACKERGLMDARVVPITQISSKLGIFDTVIMMGNNFGLFGSFERAKHLLGKLSKITSHKARIIASTNDVYDTEIPEHLEYQASNRRRGRMSGQLRIRVRYKRYSTPWFDYLIVSKNEMESILEGTSWAIKKYIDSNNTYFVAVIEKKQR